MEWRKLHTAASAAYLNQALEPTPNSPARPSFRLLARLTGSVDMTSDVKSREQLFLRLHPMFFLYPLEEPEPVRHDG